MQHGLWKTLQNQCKTLPPAFQTCSRRPQDFGENPGGGGGTKSAQAVLTGVPLSGAPCAESVLKACPRGDAPWSRLWSQTFPSAHKMMEMKQIPAKE